MNITRSDGCSDAIAISTGLHFGGNRFTELFVRNISSMLVDNIRVACTTTGIFCT